MTYPTNAEIDAAVPPGGTPNRGLTNEVLKKLAAGPSISDIDGITDIGQDVLTAASQADARASIGAGTSNLTIGTTASTAAAGDHRHPNATSTADGFMSKEDKTSLTGILADPTATTRGAPMEASEADVTAATSGGKMMSPRRVLSMIRNAISEATETLRGTLRVGTQTEVDSGTSDSVAVTPKKMRGGLADVLYTNASRRIFSTAGVHTFAVPDVLRFGVKKARVIGVGGGGGGAKRSASSTVFSGGGGGGGGMFDVLLDLKGVDSVTVTVGAAGLGATSEGSIGNPGGTTSFGAFASATGGGGGNENASRTAGGVGVITSGTGIANQGGQSGVMIEDFQDVGKSYRCAGGGSYFAHPIGPGSTPGDGLGYGAGGMGGFSTDSRAGNGASGVVIIEW